MWRIKHEQHGDTIIEVMLAMAVIGLTLGVSYGIANRAVQTGQNAQERTEAVKLAEAQVERLKNNASSDTPTDYTNNTPPLPSVFCILPGQPRVDATDPVAGCQKVNGTFYDLSMEYIPGTPGVPEVYKSTVTWDNASSGEKNRVVIGYRP